MHKPAECFDYKSVTRGTTSNLPLLTKLTFIKQICDLFYVIYIAPFKITFQS